MAVCRPLAALALMLVFDWPHALDPWSWSGHTLRVLTALGTAGAVIALVLVEMTKGLGRWFREHRTRPRLSLSHDSHVDITREAGWHPQQPRTSGQVQIAYVRLGVKNAVGHRAAPGVEVTVKRVEQVEGEPDDRLPAHNVGPLVWTHRAPVFNQLGPGVLRTVALGHVFVGDSRFYIDLGIPEPNSRVHILGPGTYRFTLTVSAANVDTENWTVTMWHDGELTADGDFTEHVKITEPPRRSS
ncbi:MAG: hypothetical protein M3P18_10985 [Actinomycetota bacterium]|nr:hypothetical protein [Actinomycetota bacterium]